MFDPVTHSSDIFHYFWIRPHQGMPIAWRLAWRVGLASRGDIDCDFRCGSGQMHNCWATAEPAINVSGYVEQMFRT